VDRLHIVGGSKKVVELHGTNHFVKCIQCNEYQVSRDKFQTLLVEQNEAWCRIELPSNPMVESNPGNLERFVVPDCKHCGGILKPTVTFFGESIDKQILEQADNLIEQVPFDLI
jgi:NAD-dependent SIR2 family protein deacetylase